MKSLLNYMKARKLNPQQQKFVLLYAQGDLSATECARQCGYSTPKQSGHRLVGTFGGEIQAHQNNLAIASGWTQSRVIAEATTVYERAMAEGHLKTGLDVLTRIHEWLGHAQPKTITHKHTHAFEDLLTRARNPRDITPALDQLPV